MEQAQKIRIDQLDFTRFLAAISIVVFHFGMVTDPFDHSSISFLFGRANVAVSYFFVLSGFVMIISSSGKSSVNFLTFLKRRLARIYPVYLFALCLTSFILLEFGQIDLVDLFLNIFLIQSWFPGTALSLNYPGWSLSTELFFYATFPFLFNKLYRVFSLKFIAAIVITFWISSQIAFSSLLGEDPVMVKYWHYMPLLHFNEFLLGNLGGLYFLTKGNVRKENRTVPIFFLVFLLIFALRFPLSYHNGLLAPLFALLTVLLAQDKGLISRSFRNKVCTFLGKISYSVYILQVPVWLLVTDYRLQKYFGITKGMDLGFYIKLTFLLLISAAVYFTVEMPLRRMIIKSNIFRFITPPIENRKIGNRGSIEV